MISFKVFYEANIANADYLKQAIEDFLFDKNVSQSMNDTVGRKGGEVERGGAIHEWFTKNLVKYLTGPNWPMAVNHDAIPDPDPPQHVPDTPEQIADGYGAGRDRPRPDGAPQDWYMKLADYIWVPKGSDREPLTAGEINEYGLSLHNYRRGEPEWMKGSDVVDFDEIYLWLWEILELTIDYFLSLSDRDREKIYKKTFEVVEQEAYEWSLKPKSKRSQLKSGKDYEVLYKDGDYAWVELKTELAFQSEGEYMNHCLGKDCGAAGTTIFSLWDKQNAPHVTIEVKLKPSGPMGAVTAEMKQIKGKQNAAPVGRYLAITARFVKKWLDEGTFNKRAKDVRELRPSRIVKGDGYRIGMFSRSSADEGFYGGEQWYFADTKIWEKIVELRYEMKDVLDIGDAALNT